MDLRSPQLWSSTKDRFEQQAELMGYPLQDKPEVAESFTKELQELKKAVADDKKAFIQLKTSKKDGKNPSCLLVKSILVQYKVKKH